jgi:CubicO group peptidase (beta-lactamase class C family)
MVFVCARTACAQGRLPSDSEIQGIIDDRVAEQRAFGIIIETRDASGQIHVYHSGSSGHAGLPLDGDAIFEIGSVTKTFTAALLADMVVHKTVSLEDPVSRYLPLGTKVPLGNGSPITLLDLATHTSGLPFLPTNLSSDIQKSWSIYTDEQLYEFLAGYTLPADIERKFRYSDTGLGLLGLALARSAGKSWEEALTGRILKPLDLSATRQTISPSMRMRLAMGHDKIGRELPSWEFHSLPGLGALRSSANDLMKYLIANLSPPPTQTGKALALTHVPHYDAFSANTQVGLGWFLGVPKDRNLVFHGGSTPGYNSFIGYDQVKNIAVVVLTNSDCDVLDIGMHLIEPAIPVADGPPTVRALHKQLVTSPAEQAQLIVQRAKENNPLSDLPEYSMNALGYRLLGQEKTSQAIEVFRMNTSLYPRSANAWDSLGEAYERAGEKSMAVSSYEQSLQLDPKNAHAAEQLRKLGKDTK